LDDEQFPQQRRRQLKSTKIIHQSRIHESHTIISDQPKRSNGQVRQQQGNNGWSDGVFDDDGDTVSEFGQKPKEMISSL